MLSGLFLLCTSLVTIFPAHGLDVGSVFLSPPADTQKSGAPVGLIYLPGADVAPTQYTPLCKAIQSAFPQPLYVAIPNIRMMPPFSLALLIDELVEMLPFVIREMETAGLPANSSFFMGGHSLGGAILQEFSGKYQSNYTKIYPYWKFEGQLLNAAFITHAWRDANTQQLVNYTTPTLTLGGELDGNCRISRIIEQYYVQLMANATADKNERFVDNTTLLRYPVVAIYGMTHAQYFDGQIPEAVMTHDLMPEINDTEARDIASEYMACWMSLILENGKCEFAFLYDGVVQSYPLAQPFISAYQLEGSYWFKKPCDCDPLICKDSAECAAGAPWMDDVVHDVNKWIPQEIMCGLKGNGNAAVSQRNTDSFHPTYQVNPIHYANIWNTCNSPNQASCVLNTSTVTQNIYAPEDYPDTGGRSSSAIEMRHKMKSRQSCYEAVNGGAVEEDFTICGQINQHSIDWAIANAPEGSKARYEKYGEMLVIGDDIEEKTGTDWTYSPLSETRVCDAKTNKYVTSVQSAYLYLKTLADGCKFKPSSECGVHYCKVLSPAHVMEWIYTDGLRFNLSISNMNHTVNATCSN